MYLVTMVMLFDNNRIDVQHFPEFSDASEHRSGIVKALKDLYKEIDFVVVQEGITTGYTTIKNGDDKKPWVVIKLEEWK